MVANRDADLQIGITSSSLWDYGIFHEPYLVHVACWKLRNSKYFDLITVYVGRNQRTADV